MNNIRYDILDKIEESNIDVALKSEAFEFKNVEDYNKAKSIMLESMNPSRIQEFPDKLEIKVFDDLVECYDYLESCYKSGKITLQEFRNHAEDIKEEIEDKIDDIESDFYTIDQLDSDDEVTDQLVAEGLVEDTNMISDDCENCLENEEDWQTLDETYDKEELVKMKGKTYNQQKIINIYRKKKYGAKKLFAHTRCVNCGREKKVFLSNLIKDPTKYGSCVCSDTNIEARMDTITGLYRGTKKLSTNTSGYTGVSFVKKYRGQPYNKWRAYIEIDGKRTYLGDFNSKSKAIKARKAAASKGLKWYQNNKNQFMSTSRHKHKKYKKNSK